MSEKELVEELLTITEATEDGKVTFTDRSIEILQELGQQYKETALFKKSREDNPDWEGDANAGLLFVYMCERLTEAPSRIHTMIVCKLMTPLIWEKLEQEICQMMVDEEKPSTVVDGFTYSLQQKTMFMPSGPAAHSALTSMQ